MSSLTTRDAELLATQLKHWMLTTGRNYVPANVKKFRWHSWFGAVRSDARHLTRYFADVEGRVVHYDHQWVVVRITPSQFFVTVPSLLEQAVGVGDRVHMSPPPALRFDGKRLDGRDDPAVDGCLRYMVTGLVSLPVCWAADDAHYARADESEGRYPVSTITCSYLKQLVLQLEESRNVIHGSDGRNALSAIADERPTVTRFVEANHEPNAHRDRKRWAGIEWDFPTGRRLRSLAVRYNAGRDTYEVDWVEANGTEYTAIDVMFDELPEVLHNAVVSPDWNKVQVNVIAPARNKRAA